jgi:hypothetical protein
MDITPAEAELLTLLKYNNCSLASIGWPMEWSYDPFRFLWTKPGLRFHRNGTTITTDHVLSEGQIAEFAYWARVNGVSE